MPISIRVILSTRSTRNNFGLSIFGPRPNANSNGPAVQGALLSLVRNTAVVVLVLVLSAAVFVLSAAVLAFVVARWVMPGLWTPLWPTSR